MKVIFAKTSWVKLVLLYYGPTAFIIALWVILSNRNISQVLTWNNFTTHSGIVGSPFIALLCLAIYYFLILRLTISQIRSNGRYIWIDGKNLKWADRVIGNKDDILRSSVRIERRGLFKQLVIELSNGREKTIPLMVAVYDRDLPDAIRRAVGGIDR